MEKSENKDYREDILLKYSEQEENELYLIWTSSSADLEEICQTLPTVAAEGALGYGVLLELGADDIERAAQDMSRRRRLG